MRIGASDGPDSLQSIGAIVVSPQTGNIIVGDGQRISVFDSAGRRLQAFRRYGSGRGEFQNLLEVHWSDGLILATDGFLHRVTTFTEHGELVNASIVESGPLPSVAGRARPVAPLVGEFFLGVLVEQIEYGGQIGGRTLLVRINGTGGDSILDSFPSPTKYILTDRGGIFGMSVPGIQYDVHPMGTHVVIVHQFDPDNSRSAVFRVRKIAPDGRILFSHVYGYAPTLRPEGYVRRRAFAAFTARDERIVENHSPRYLVPVREVRVGVDGSIWLKREEEQGDLVWWTVLDEWGEPMASLRLPTRVAIRHIDGDSVWGFETDAVAVYYVVKYRLVRGPGMQMG